MAVTNASMVTNKTIVVAGATGNLGGRIVDALLEQGAGVRAMVPVENTAAKIDALGARGVRSVAADWRDEDAVAAACAGAGCVVSTLSGLREVVIDAQKALLDGAVRAGVPRFIPSDYSLDFTRLAPGGNRNLDWRREFHHLLDAAKIQATTVFNGAFMELLTTDMPLILSRFRRVLCWGNPRVRMDLTTMDDVAEYTAHVALDDQAPRYLRIAGDAVTAADVRAIASRVTGETYRLFRAGGIGRLNRLIGITRFFALGEQSLYPAWQGMQYMRDMMQGRAELQAHDNGRYPALAWTSVEAFLKSRAPASG